MRAPRNRIDGPVGLAGAKREHLERVHDPRYVNASESSSPRNGSVHLDPVSAEDFRVSWRGGRARVIGLVPGEIVTAIRLGHVTLDGIKYFTRAQMGRCQGGFCTYKIIKIIMRETGMGWDEVTKRGGGSRVLKGEL